MLLCLEEALHIDHSSRANFGDDERNIMMAILTLVKVLSPFFLGNLFDNCVEVYWLSRLLTPIVYCIMMID